MISDAEATGSAWSWIYPVARDRHRAVDAEGQLRMRARQPALCTADLHGTMQTRCSGPGAALLESFGRQGIGPLSMPRAHRKALSLRSPR